MMGASGGAQLTREAQERILGAVALEQSLGEAAKLMGSRGGVSGRSVRREMTWYLELVSDGRFL